MVQHTIDFDHLIKTRSFPCVSIYIGNDQAWPENRRAMLAFRAQVKKATAQLETLGLSEKEISDLFDPIESWASEAEPWKNTARSLVAFVSPGHCNLYEVDMEFEDSMHIGHFYDIRALVPMRNFVDFYLLSLSQDKVALFLVQASGYKELKVPNLPKNIAELTQFDDPEKNLQQYSVRSLSGQDSAQFHGHGRNKDYKKVQLDQFAGAIANAVGPFANGSSKYPMVVVGLPPLSSLFMEHNIYSEVIHVIERDPGSQPESVMISNIRRNEYQDWLSKRQDGAEDILRSHKSMPTAESRVSEILKRAQEGQVLELFIKQQDYVWGSFDPDEQKIKVLREHTADSEDLLNIASVYTLQTGGSVHLFDPRKFSTPEHAVAILR